MATLILAVIGAALALALVVREREHIRQREEWAAERKALSARVAEREGLAHVGQLVTGIAQELKSPLQGVIGGTEVMLQAAQAGGTPVDDLRQIRDDAARAAGIVRNILAFADPASLDRRWFDLNDLVTRTLDDFHADRRGIAVEVHRAEHLPLVYVDGRRLRHVLNTFLPSADMPSSHVPMRLTVTTSMMGDDRLAIEMNEQGLPIAVEEHAAWANELAACHHVLEAHGGSLVVNRSNGGVQVHIELPVTAGVDDVSGRVPAPTLSHRSP